MDAVRIACSMQSKVYVTVKCPSVRLSRRSTAAAAYVWFAAERPASAVFQLSIDICCRRRRSAANVGSVMLRAEVRGSTRTYLQRDGRDA